MTSLERLFRRRGGGPVQEQERISGGFLAALGQSRLGVRDAGGPISDTGVHVVVGLMVAWSEYDRRLAVGLDRAIAEGHSGADTIQVFNGDSVSTLEDLRLYIPDLEEERALQNPWVGVWEDGRRWLSLGGSAAAAWLRDRYGIPSAD